MERSTCVQIAGTELVLLLGGASIDLPIYREQDYFAGSSRTPTRSSLGAWLDGPAAASRPHEIKFAEALRYLAITGIQCG